MSKKKVGARVTNAQTTHDDDEQVLLAIAAAVLAFFVGLAAWLMAPDYFTEEPIAKSTIPDSTSKYAVVDYRPESKSTSTRSTVRPVRTVQSLQAAQPTLVTAQTTTVPKLEVIAPVASLMPSTIAKIATAAIADEAPSAEIFVPTEVTVAAEPPTQPVQEPLPLTPPKPEVVDVATNEKWTIATVITEANSIVSFHLASVALTDESKMVLDKVARLMSDNPTKRLGIIGHTDGLGDADTNVKLSFARAQACARYLAEQGVRSSRIDAAGMGEQMPLASNQTRKGRQRNRRVEFRLL